jgi:hemerythrin superfamily protein
MDAPDRKRRKNMSEAALIKLGKQNPETLRDIFIKARRSLDQTAPDSQERSAALFKLADIADAMYAAGL